ncbi:hypothetical protein P3X46_019615 [Hevea brasiliensis]|uniref:PGG domain-containing protein n=1 Tax=Hevea brasiliensis TaxID=3981 RepID=A0ABQ9LMC4_HEVBR|nr:hypothetical protein P3X46_019615 [Hevea brasiliensis]
MYLINRMSRLQLGLQNSNGDTVLSIAAIVGNTRAAIMIVNKQPNLPQIGNRDGGVPLLEAARHGQKEMISYLLEVNGDYLQAAEYSADKPGVFFMNLLVLAGFYDLALELVQSHPPLARVEYYGGESLLSAMASKPSAFPSGIQLDFWHRLIHCFPPMKGIRDVKLMHHQTLQLIKCLCTEIACLDYEKASMMLRRPFLLAAELGIYEIMEEIMESFPHAIWFSDNENHNLFHIAVMNRQENVFNLLYQISDYKHRLLVSEDIFGNNILHLAGKLAPQHRLNLISGAALQMQYELRWFKEVEKIVQLACKEDKNSEGRTPAMLFTEEHKRLVKEGEKWMKDTASSCTVAAALIATVIFAAAITVPGGNNNDDVSDALSLFSSVAAILMFLSILTARYAEADFLYSLPKRLIFGLVTLFLSITSMMVAFSATLYLVFCNRKAWMLIPVGALACLPISLFVSLQFPLLVDMIYSTYKPRFFGKKSKCMLH